MFKHQHAQIMNTRHLQSEKVAFLGAHVHGRAAPEVPRADSRPVRQQVPDNQVLVGGSCDLKSRLRNKAQGRGRGGQTCGSTRETLNDTLIETTSACSKSLPARCVLSGPRSRSEPFSPRARTPEPVCLVPLQCEESWRLGKTMPFIQPSFFFHFSTVI